MAPHYRVAIHALLGRNFRISLYFQHADVMRQR